MKCQICGQAEAVRRDARGRQVCRKVHGGDGAAMAAARRRAKEMKESAGFDAWREKFLQSVRGKKEEEK